MYSTEQLARIITIVAVIFGLKEADVNTTVQVIATVIAVLSQAYGWLKRYSKGDVTALGFRK